MKNCIILGSGRSGTSMVAGAFAKAGFFLGEQLYEPRESNPKGFFEDRDINLINEDLLAPLVQKRPPLLGRWFFRDRPLYRQRWLSVVPLQSPIPCHPRIAKRIQSFVARQPFCFKDPRFSYTLPAWRPFLENPVYVCVFRDPGVTARSIVKECQTTAYLQSLDMSEQQALQVWRCMYEHIVRSHCKEGKWLFLHYDQVLSGQAMHGLEEFVEAPLDHTFADPMLRRSAPMEELPKDVVRLYEELCELAGYR